MTLNAWIAKGGKRFAADVAAVRSHRKTWRRGCDANATGTAATRPKPPDGICDWLAGSPNAAPPRPWREPPCEAGGVWGRWCTVAGNYLPGALV